MCLRNRNPRPTDRRPSVRRDAYVVVVGFGLYLRDFTLALDLFHHHQLVRSRFVQVRTERVVEERNGFSWQLYK